MSASPSPTPDRSRVPTALTAVARKEFTHAVRSRSLQTLLVVLLVATIVVFRAVGENTDSSLSVAIDLLGVPLQLIVPIAAILAAESSVSGERESGSLRLLLGMPVSRSEVVLGKLLGIFAALGVGIGVASLSVVLLSITTYGAVPLSEFVGLVVATVLLAGAFGGFAVGVSAAVSTRNRSIAVTIGGLFAVTFLWEPIVAGTYYVVNGTLPSSTVPVWLVFLDRLNPLNAYAVAATVFGAGAVSPLQVTFGLLEDGARTALAVQGGETVSISLTDPFSLAVLVGWAVVPIGIGIIRFRTADLTYSSR